MTSKDAFRLRVKRILFPGLDLHTRCRQRRLAPLIECSGLTLDAGFGNGAMSLIAHRKDNTVVGVSFSEREVSETRRFLAFSGIGEEQIKLLEMNIYELRQLNQSFDQIICSETLEHLARDREVIEMFSEMLKPGGRLILCCPYALHPEHHLGRTDEPENGYHVRDGYTFDSYRKLLEGTGLEITRELGLGSPLLCQLDRVLRHVRLWVGDAMSLPLFCLMWPLTFFDRANPRVPFSVAIVARK